MTDMTVGHSLRFVKRRDSSEDNPGELILDEEYRLEKYHLIFVSSRINLCEPVLTCVDLFRRMLTYSHICSTYVNLC